MPESFLPVLEPANPPLLSATQLPNSPEPIFVPKIQISFADFPYLHYSNRPEAIHLGYRLRI